jgi:hypothetical protein
MQARRRRFPRRCHRTNGRFFKAPIRFNAVVSIAAKIAPVRFGARAPIHAGRAVPTRMPCHVFCKNTWPDIPLKGNNHPMLASALDQVFSNERALLL